MKSKRTTLSLAFGNLKPAPIIRRIRAVVLLSITRPPRRRGKVRERVAFHLERPLRVP